jgi:RNA polymerase sigma factor (sigma-70 family)
LIRQLTELERRLLHNAGYSQPLWVDAMRLVLFVFHNLKKRGLLQYQDLSDMDIVQVGNVAAGEALHKWIPDKGTFATFLYPYISGAMLNFAADEARWARLIKDSPVEAENAPNDAIESPPDDDSLDVWEAGVSEELDDEPYRLLLADQLALAISKLPDQLYTDLVDRYYLDLPVTQLAADRGISPQAVYNHIKQAVTKLQEIFLVNFQNP